MSNAKVRHRRARRRHASKLKAMKRAGIGWRPEGFWERILITEGLNSIQELKRPITSRLWDLFVARERAPLIPSTQDRAIDFDFFDAFRERLRPSILKRLPSDFGGDLNGK